MKKYLALAAALSIAATLYSGNVARAQAPAPAPAPAPAAPAQRTLGSYLKELNLTPAQKTHVKSISTSFKTQMASIKANTTLTAAQKKTQLVQLRKTTIQSIVAVLTPAQKQQLKALRAQDKTAPAK